MAFCLLSECKSYRWILKRELLTGKKKVVFFGLNPSIANSVSNDRTLLRLISFCKKWDYRNIYIINLFGLISKSPNQLKRCTDPLGKNNDLVTILLLEFWCKNIDCDLWLGWGDKGGLNNRDVSVLNFIRNLSDLNLTETNPSKRILSLGLTQKGNPRHPLYMPNNSQLKPFDL